MSTRGDRSAVRATGLPRARNGRSSDGDGVAPDAASPAAVDPAGEQVLSRTEHTRVVRIPAVVGNGTLIRKEMFGPGGVARARQEAAILERLAGIAGVSRLIEPPTGPSLIVDDKRGTPLAAMIGIPAAGPVDVDGLLALAIGVAELLAQVHQRGVVHKDLNPVNILVGNDDQALFLIDFGLAGMATDDRSDAAGKIIGTLAYLAPEQSGRTGHAVDQRADLYALGATLYELATGRPPFGRGETDSLALIHDHLARVPVPVRDVVPYLPQSLSDVIARLLEKEPGRRYQSATGLAVDLRRVRDRPSARFTLGERDFPLQLSAPVPLVARTGELGVLHSAVQDARAGRQRGLLISGEPGVGKSALLEELRPIVAASGGWVISAAFGQNDLERSADAVGQALRGLGRLLLAEPEEALAAHREKLLAGLGCGAEVMAALLGEFQLLLGVEPQMPIGDPQQVQSQIYQVVLEVLRLTCATRPVVMVLDDLQWAAGFPLGLVDVILAEPDLPGLLLVGAYREVDSGTDSPFPRMLDRWTRLGIAPPQLRLQNLPPAALSELLREMLRIPTREADRLGAAIGARTGGNPYDTVELLNALREDGTLVAGASGWTWDPVAIRRHVGQGEVVDRLSARIDRLPVSTSTVLEVLACLGGWAGAPLLAVAAGLSAAGLVHELASAVDDGLVTLDEDGSVRFRHDRVRQAVYQRLDSEAAAARHLAVARRTASETGLGTTSAEQYLQAVGTVTDPVERRRVAALFRGAAGAARVTDLKAGERFLAAATALLDASDPNDPPAGPAQTAEPAELAEMQIEHHAALQSLGRLEESDRLYRLIEARDPDPLALAAPTCVQIDSLTNRARPLEALALGLGLLARLGLSVPAADRMDDEIERGGGELYQWVAADTRGDDLLRPEVTDPWVVAVTSILNRLMPPAYFADHQVLAWLVVAGRRLWAEHGPCRALIGPLTHAGFVLIERHEDYRTGYQVVERILTAGIGRGWEVEAARARFLFSVGSGHWVDSIEEDLEQARDARDALLLGGDLQTAVFTYHTSTPTLLDCAPTLESYLPTVEAGLALAARSGNDQTVDAGLAYRQLVRALRGETDEVGGFTDSSFDEAAFLAGLDANPMAAVNFHITRALAAALFGDQVALSRHARAAMPLLPYVVAAYPTSRARLVLALALAGEARTAEPAERVDLIEQLDTCRAWLAARAEDAPGNFSHLVALVDAERAWAIGDSFAAVTGFNTALAALGAQQRPWHRALVFERAALFHLSHGHEFLARRFLVAARDAYAVWGAVAKVDQLTGDHPFLRSVRVVWTISDKVEPDAGVAGVSTDAMDLLAVLEASQVLSSETDLDRLRGRVVDVLSAMTGATGVSVVLWNEEAAGWVLPTDSSEQSGLPELGVVEAAAAGRLPLSAFRYAERTRQPLLVPDATADDRFATDPYLTGVPCCSLLVVPILSQGVPRVMLMLENRLQRSAFSADRLDGVLLIAGQLAVSFDNAQAKRLSEQEADRRLRLLETLRQRERLLETLLSIQRDISHRAPLQQVLDSVTGGASAMLDGDFVALVLVDPLDPAQPRIPSISGRVTGAERDCLVLSVATEAIARDQLVAGPVGSDDGAGLIAAPVHASGSIIGSLVTGAGAGAGARFDPERRAHRQDLLSAFAEQVSLALNDASTLQAIREASYDSLTGLASRPLFLDRLRAALEAGSSRGGEVTVLFIDLDRFKAVNDSLGHQAGDDLLAEVADRIRGCLREADVAARLGGDEFAVLLEVTEGAGSGLRVAGKVLSALQHPFRIVGKDIFVSASIGMAHSPAGDCGATELLGQADVAMYRAKKEGSRRAVVFEAQMHVEVAERLELQGDLRSAIGTDAIRLQYQPLISLRTGRPVGVEALVRWNHPLRGPISPVTFIPIAEETGVIVELGHWVLQESCRQIARWRAATDSDLGLSVNVSGRQLMDGQLQDGVAAVLAETGLPASALTLELTETVLMDDPADSQRRLSELKRLGVRLAIDDFGTGYSSLAYLREFPVDELKIDKSFIDTIGTAEADLAIVRTVIELSRILGLRTTAEGIESSHQAELLQGLGCSSGQGYLFARPMDGAGLSAYLAEHRPDLEC